MKSSAIHRFREKLEVGESVYGLWVTLEAIAVTDIAAGLGLEWLVIDADYGHLDWAEILEHVRATNRSNTLALVRVNEARPDLIQRVIDIGADGILISKTETAAQLKFAIQCAQYATAEKRVRQFINWDQSFARAACKLQENALIIPLIETAHGVRNICDLLQVDGVDAFFFHPLSNSGEIQFTCEAEGAAVATPCMSIIEEIRSHGKHAGIVAVSDAALMSYRDYGFRMLGMGFDSSIIRDGIRDALDIVRKPEDRGPALSTGAQAAALASPDVGCKETRY